MLCEEHTVPIKQSYWCPGTDEAEGHYNVNTVRGVENAEGWTIMTTPKPAVDTESPTPNADKKAINLYPIPAFDVAANTFVGESIYYIVPSGQASNQAWSILAGVIRKGKVALVTKAAFTPNEKMYQLQLFRGYLVLRELVYPDKIAEAPPAPEAKIDKAMTTLVEQFIDNLVEPWDKFDSSDTNAKRFDAWLATGKQVAGPEVQVKDAESSSPINLMETLKRAVEDAKKK